MRLVARPAMAEPITSRVLCSLPFWVCDKMPSTPPAAIAAVRTRLPLSPPQPPGSLRARTASPTPARRAALRASAACCLPRLLPLLPPRDEDDDERRRLLLRPPRSRDLDREESFLPERAPITPPRPTPSRTFSVVDLRRSLFFGGGDRLRDESSEYDE